MENMSWGLLVGVASLIATLCTIAGFLLGRRKEAVAEGQQDGTFKADITYIKNTMTDLKTSVEKLDNKIESNQEKLNDEYKQLLVEVVKLKEVSTEMQQRIGKLEKLHIKLFNHSAHQPLHRFQTYYNPQKIYSLLILS